MFTHRRHHLVRRICRYYAEYPGELVIVDGTPEPLEGAVLPPRAAYLHRPGMSGYARIAEGIARASAPTCTLAADDDFHSIDALRECAGAILSDPGVVCAAGTAVYFADGRRSVRDAVTDAAVERLLWIPRSVGPVERFRRTIAYGPQVYFACVRTSVAREVSGMLADLPDEGGLVGEQLWTSLPALFGRSVLVPRLQMCRRMGFRDYSGYLAPFRAMRDVSEWSHFALYADRIRVLCSRAGIDPAGADEAVAAWRRFAASTADGDRRRRKAQPTDAAWRLRRMAWNALQTLGVAVRPWAIGDPLERKLLRARAVRPLLRAQAYPWSDADARAEYERIMAFDERSAAGA